MLQELKTFMSIVELNDIIKVTESLNLSKATVYEHIKYLEQYFRANIALVPENNNIIITESGNSLYERANQIFNIIDNTPVEFVQYNTAVSGNIKLGVNPALEEYVLPKFLSYFLNKYPNITVDISADDNESIRNRLKENKIILGLMEEFEDDSNFVQKRFLKDRMVLIIPYAKTIKDISEYMNDFRSKRWIMKESTYDTQNFVDLFLNENNINPESIITLRSNYAVKEAVKNNLGISIISKFAAELAYRNDEICILPLGNSYERYFTYILNEEDYSECVRIFLNELKDYCKHFYR